MITASRDILYNILVGEWKGLNIRVLQVSNGGDVYTKVFRMEDFVFDEVDACDNCGAPAVNCDECDGVVEILALVGYVYVKKRKIEEGVIIPLLGDVLFDLREGHVVILSDTDITVISRAGENAVAGRDDNQEEQNNEVVPSTIKGKNVNVNIRMYLVSDNKIKRLALNALHDGRLFQELAGRKAVVAELTYAQQDKNPVYFRSLRFFYVYFDMDGRVNEELTFPRKSHRINGGRERITKGNVVELGRRDKQPVLTKEQKEAIKSRLMRDFGDDVWESTPMRVKAILD